MLKGKSPTLHLVVCVLANGMTEMITCIALVVSKDLIRNPVTMFMIKYHLYYESY